ncbi:hypothetical protein [Halobacteriovorax sp.]|uniref:hypothetical protein n=1 Tax=Halobacteriovorax sp. TaxID=2020862 RepID=UPI003AF316E8
MKALLIILIFSSSFFVRANTIGVHKNTISRSGNAVDDWKIDYRSGNANDDWKTLPIIELRGGVVGDIDTLRNLNNIGDFNLDSESDRWILRTRSRLLSVRDIELVDKFETKQFEVKKVSNRLKRLNDIVDQKYLESIVKRSVKFKDYNIKDFEY